MSSYQKFICVGNLTKDPVGKATQTGMTVCEFTVAVNGTKQDDPTFYAQCVAYGKTGDNCLRYLAKGSAVLVEGKLRSDKWTNKQTGAEMQKTTIVCASVQFMGGNTGNRTQNATEGAKTAPVANVPQYQPIFQAPYQPQAQPSVTFQPTPTPPPPVLLPADDVPF